MVAGTHLCSSAGVVAADGSPWKPTMTGRMSSLPRSGGVLRAFPVVVALAAVTLGIASPVARAEEGGVLEFGAGLGTSWYDHRSPVSGANEYSLQMLRPFARFHGPLAGWDIRGQAQSRIEFYSGAGVDTLMGDGPHHNDRIDATAVRRWSEREDLTFQAGYLRTNDVLDADQAAIAVDDDLTRFHVGAGTHAGLFEGSGRIRSTDYDRDALSDGLALGATLRLVPLRQDAYDAFAGADFTQLDVDETTALASRALYGGYRRHLAPTLSAEVRAGAVAHRFDDGGQEQKFLLGFGIERDPRRVGALAASLDARFEGDSLAAISALARYPLASGRLWLRAESSADAEGGLYRSATRTLRFTVGGEDTLARANVLGAETSYARARPFRGDGPVTTTLRASLYAMRRVQPRLNARIAASYLREPFGFSATDGPVLRRIRLDAELIVLSGGFAG